ncbi:helix-turn-helix domain-containing protein [Streptomyces niveiscabiei]|uniref:helix-turn-helix domain-containing protein n=1 Tax=Streptomyces niveiscabiei TaxID=164115 RepID=UPI0029B17609|nr:helix-turn-helix domain-containing protein [Streptomyces niveiscabiei]MDX3383944.1 helix-turn-helix domain-containing protein [Streptomyces niveiscabiei]
MTIAEQLPALTRLRHARERFLAGGTVPEGVPEEVVAAWRRARFHGVRRDAGGEAAPVVGAAPVLEAARPVLERLASALDGRSALVFTDARLRVLWSGGVHPHGRPRADLSEERVGPNSAATALRTGRRAEVHGPEHFLDDWQETSAVSAPVRAPGATRPVGTVTVTTRLCEGCMGQTPDAHPSPPRSSNPAQLPDPHLPDLCPSDGPSDRAGSRRAGAHSASSGLAGSRSSGVDSASSGLAGSRSSGVDSASSGLAGSRSSGAHPASSDLVGSRPSGVDSASSDPAGSRPPAAHPASSDPAGPPPSAAHPTPSHHPSAALAEAVAAAVEAELLARSATPERLLLDAYLSARTGDRPVAAFGGHSRLVDDLAARALTPEDLHRLERAALKDPEARQLTVAGRRVELTPVRQGEATVGVVAVLNPAPVQNGAEPCRTRPPLLITGERGTGKTTLARELTPHARTVDAAESELGDAVDHLTAGHPLILRHAERLAPPDIATLNSLLDTHPTAQLYVTYTPGTPPGPCLQRLLDVLAARTITLPALRERPEDIAELLRTLAPKPPAGQPPLTWSLDALRALERHPWPGNLTELTHVVHALAQGRRLTGPVRRAELPDAVREGPAHRPLSPMEDAERTAILQALKRHGGNKARAASALGIGRATLYRKLRSYRG